MNNLQSRVEISLPSFTNDNNAAITQNSNEENLRNSTNATDNEALSSLLMLATANAELPLNETEEKDKDQKEKKPRAKKNSQPSTERSTRGESNQPLAKSVTIDELRQFFHLPIVEVARQLGTCTTALKKICRKNYISKWPYRKIRSISKSIQSLEMASLNDNLSEDIKKQYQEHIAILQRASEELIADPNKDLGAVNDLLLSKNEDGDDDDQSEDKAKMPSKAPRANKRKIEETRALIIDKSKLLMTTNNTVEGANKRLRLKTTSSPAADGAEINSAARILASSAGIRSVPTEADPTKTAVNLGTTIVACEIQPDSKKVVFSGPVCLAPLQRKKVRPGLHRKVVPLMEPDIGSNFSIEFVPQFMLGILNKSLVSRTLLELENRLDQGSVILPQQQG